MKGKILKIREWLDTKNMNQLTYEEIRKFAKNDLTTITLVDCLIDSEYKQEVELLQNKSEITDEDQLDLIEQLNSNMEWFFVFLPKNNLNIANILYDQFSEKSLSKQIIENISKNYTFTEECLRYVIFPKEMKFTYLHRGEFKSFQEYFTAIDENICKLQNITVENIGAEKLRFFNFHHFIDTSATQFSRFAENALELVKLYKEGVNNLNQFHDIQNTEDFIAKIMPRQVRLTGNFTLSKTEINYKLMDNPLQAIDSLLDLNKQIHTNLKNKKNSFIKSFAYTGVKLGLAYMYPPSAAMLIKDAVDMIDLTKDSIETLSKQFDVQLESLEYQKILKGYEESEHDKFKDYFIDFLRKMVYYNLYSELKLTVQLPEHVFNNLYTQFKENYLNPTGKGKMEKGTEYQLEESRDKDHFLLKVICG